MSKWISLGPLFEADICSRKHKGNEESRGAFEALKDRLPLHRARVLKAIRDSDGGLTVDEIAQKLGVTPNMVSGRASELKRDGMIRRNGTRLTRNGNPAAILVAL